MDWGVTRLAIALEPALDVAASAAALVRGVASTLGGAGDPAGALVLSTAAAGRIGEAVGHRLAAYWPRAELVGTSLEGLALDGRVHQGVPAVALLAWTAGSGAPEPFACEVDESDPERLLRAIHPAAGGDGAAIADDLVLLFPDALGTPALPALLERRSGRNAGPWFAGAAAVGVEGGPAHAWSLAGPAVGSGSLVGLRIPGSATPGGPAAARIQRAGATRLASPWLEITACRSHWIDALEDEPPLAWIRRQLGLFDGERVEPHLDRLLVRIAPRTAGSAARAGDPDGDREPSEPAPLDCEERYLTGIDRRRGSIGVLGRFARGDRLALALPDPALARESLRTAVDALPRTPLLLHLGCSSRGESLHGDRDLEAAIVAERGRDRRAFGVVAPFQVAGGAGQPVRQLVHASVLAALGPVEVRQDSSRVPLAAIP